MLLSDFGIVRLVRKEDVAATLTLMGAFVGSSEYAAPFLVQGEAIDHRVDVYALGVVLFYMLTGRLPFAGATAVSLLMMQAQQLPPLPRSLNPTISPAMEAVILKALAKTVDGRYQTMAEFQAALRAASADPSVGTTHTSPPSAGTIADLPTVSTYGVPPDSGSGPAVFPEAGPGAGPPPVWGGPGSGWTTGWAAPASGPAAAPPLPPTYATGLALLPQQAPIAPTPTRPPRRWRKLPVLLLAIVLVTLEAQRWRLDIRWASSAKTARNRLRLCKIRLAHAYHQAVANGHSAADVLLHGPFLCGDEPGSGK